MHAAMDVWEKEQTRVFISLLKQCTCLYNPRDPYFSNKEKRDEKYNFILREMKVFRPCTTVAGIKRKIKTLQTQLSKERSKALTVKRSGAEPESYKPKLWCYNELQFMIHCNESVPSSTSNIDPQSSADETLMTGTNPLDDDDNSSTKRVKLSSQYRKEALEALALAKDLARNKPYEPLGKEEEFCRYLCSELKTIWAEEAFEDLKMEILQLVQEKKRQQRRAHAQMEMFETTPYTKQEQDI